MDKIIVTRKKKFASAVMPFWLILSSSSKEAFMQEHNLEKDLCDAGDAGFPIPRLTPEILDRAGIRISSGQTIEIPLQENIQTIFASTMDGSLSNEIRIQDMKSDHLTLTVKGGFATISYPYLLEE